jgi:hypothetical protein
VVEAVSQDLVVLAAAAAVAEVLASSMCER